jgi:hypothetical protein
MKRLGIILLSLLAAVSGFDVAAADEEVAVQGRVQWIAGQTLVIAPDGRPSIKVDLTEAPQDEYAGLVTGDRVFVMGMVTNEEDRVIATSIERLGS